MIEKLNVPADGEEVTMSGVLRVLLRVIKKINELIDAENARTWPFIEPPQDPEEPTP